MALGKSASVSNKGWVDFGQELLTNKVSKAQLFWFFYSVESVWKTVKRMCAFWGTLIEIGWHGRFSDGLGKPIKVK